MPEPRKILVTSALPYANGAVHVGHLVEYLQTDTWVRFQRMRGHRVVYLCADDTHGTAIMLRAKKEGVSEESLIATMSEAHQRDFAAFGIEFDHYGSTNSKENRELCHELWDALGQAGLIVEKEVAQLFDPREGLFLADRLVKGDCPRCETPDQYGDSCESCGATYSASELKNPRSAVSGAVPEVRSAKHLFVRIESLHGFLDEWTQAEGHLQSSVANYLKGHFLSAPLMDWDVSRPAPYFGFEIPNAPGHFWYVWFDAPIGYLATTRQWCQATGGEFDEYWRSDETEIVHFIGKDITYFHALFWPAMLRAAKLTLPSRIHVHGFLTVNGEKMSKSKGTQIQASTYLEHLDPSYLRYYYASKLGQRPDDLDLDLDDFVARVNADLVGKVVNLASRSVRFLESTGLADRYPDDGGLFAAGAKAADEIAEAYESCDFAKAMRLIMKLADRANEYVDRMQPWKLAKDPDGGCALRDACSVALNSYRQIAIYLAPVLPDLAHRSGQLLGEPLTQWSDAQQPLTGRKLGRFEHLMARADPRKVKAMLEASASQSPPAEPEPKRPAAPTTAASAEPIAEPCSFEDFQKIDLRVARVIEASVVEASRKLLRLRVSLGSEERTILAGLRRAYAPESLTGRLIVVVANLPPRKMKVGTSEGMAIAAGPGESEVFLLAPDSGAVPGQRVH